MNILVSYNWLKHYVAIKDSPEDLARKLSLSGPSVERINHTMPQFTNVVVGRILDIKKHPNADKLQLVKVTIGKDRKILDIVCGAFNIKVGNKVPVALPGATLADRTKISERQVRGIKSQGMLCTEKELGISDDHGRIFILPESSPAGIDLAKVLGLEDYIFDAEITTNRPDALGMVGFAREAAAITGAKFLWRENDFFEMSLRGPASWRGRSNLELFRLDTGLPRSLRSLAMTNEGFSDWTRRTDYSLSVKVEDKKACPRYMAIVMDGIKVQESPFWLKKRLINAGLRPKNNMVDVTNYVMLEYGQPLHAFDFEKIESSNSESKIPKGKSQTKKIIVRRASDSEEIETLDGVKRKLNSEILVIADSKKPIAVAGVIGGANSAVSEKTRTIIIEAANFNPLRVRRSARFLNLLTDSSARFEKGLSVQLPHLAILKAVELIGDLAGGEQVSRIIDVNKSPYFPLYKRGIKGVFPKKVSLEFSYLYQKLGTLISSQKVIKILQSLGFKIVAKSKNRITVIVPYWRMGDIEIRDDLIEEVARIYGYYKLPSLLPNATVPLDILHNHFDEEERIKDFLADLGFTEVYSSSMVSEKILSDFGLNSSNTLRIKNPLNEDLVYMRICLIPSLLKIISANLRYKNQISIFELANVYLPKNKNSLPKEKMMLTIASVDSSFERFKGVLEVLFKKLGIRERDLASIPSQDTSFHPGRTADIEITKGAAYTSYIGMVGQIHPMIAKKFGIDLPVIAAEIDWEVLVRFTNDKKVFVPIAKYPSVKMDLAIVLGKKIYWSDIYSEILKVSPLIKEIGLFDTYIGKEIGKDRKSLAFHIVCQSENRTLKDEEVKAIVDKILERLKSKFGAELRK